MCWSNYKLNSSSLWSVHHKSQWYDLLISSFQPSDHGRSKRSGWSGFGRTSFHGQFWNCACADNEQWITRWGRSYNLSSTCAYTPHALSAPKYSWYSYLGMHGHSNRQYHRFNGTGWYDIRHTSKWTKSFPSAYLGKDSCFPGSGFSQWQRLDWARAKGCDVFN